MENKFKITLEGFLSKEDINTKKSMVNKSLNFLKDLPIGIDQHGNIGEQVPLILEFTSSNSMNIYPEKGHFSYEHLQSLDKKKYGVSLRTMDNGAICLDIVQHRPEVVFADFYTSNPYKK